MNFRWIKLPNDEWSLHVGDKQKLLGCVWVRYHYRKWQMVADFTVDQNWENLDECNSLEEAQQVALIRYRMEN